MAKNGKNNESDHTAKWQMTGLTPTKWKQEEQELCICLAVVEKF